MLFDEVVEVISINPATDVITGDLVYQVIFGIIGSPMQGLPLSAPQKQIASNRLILYFKVGEGSPYLAGSKWKMKVENDGRISLEKSVVE
jgi:hypothetical protein